MLVSAMPRALLAHLALPGTLVARMIRVTRVASKVTPPVAWQAA